MIKNDRLQHIALMEENLNAANQLLAEMATLQQRWNALQPQIFALKHYYHSPDWLNDVEASQNGEFPASLPCGVLSEDAIFNFLTEEHQQALQWIKWGVKALEGEDE